MRRDHRWAWLALVLGLGGPACKHDYDALRAQSTPDIRAGQGGSGDGGSGGSGGSGGNGGSGGRSGGSGGMSGSGGTGGMSGTGGSAGSSGAGGSMCEPCDEPTEAAMELGLVSCCRGPAGDQCGLAVDDGQTCYALDTPGVEDTACQPIGPVGARHQGCCRVDGRCGALFDGLGLGCVAREDIPEAIAPNAEPVACEVACEEDVDCEGLPDVATVCVPDRQRPADRYCAVQCQRDGACAEGLVCALSPDVARDRLMAFCQLPYGAREPDEVCTAANQCIHGVCLQLEGEPAANCSQFCDSDADCPSERRFCVTSSIGRPSGTGTPIDFKVCSPRND